MAYEPRGIAVLSGSAGTEIFKVLDDSSLVLKAKTIGGVAAASGSILMVDNTATGNVSTFNIAGTGAAMYVGFDASANASLSSSTVQQAIIEVKETAAAASNLCQPVRARPEHVARALGQAGDGGREQEALLANGRGHQGSLLPQVPRRHK